MVVVILMFSLINTRNTKSSAKSKICQSSRLGLIINKTKKIRKGLFIMQS